MNDDRLTIVHDDHNLTVLADSDGTIILSLTAALVAQLSMQPQEYGRCELTIPPALRQVAL